MAYIRPSYTSSFSSGSLNAPRTTTQVQSANTAYTQQSAAWVTNQARQQEIVERAAAAQAAEQQRLQAEAARQAEMSQLAEQMRAEQARIAEAQRFAEAARQEQLQRQAAQQQQIEAQRLAQQQMLAMRRLATQAATQSMQVLEANAGSYRTPVAQMTRRPQGGPRVRATAGSQGLRIGSLGRGPGVGLNIGG